ncbi:hypothetical protein HCH52_07385 [Oscillospiraceae bacterium HV4-5-C5C]|nr:hypothetical protein [Oscillospiraceae bacterium HV4-5-C5C]
MAKRAELLYFTVQELENQLGQLRLPAFIAHCEADFMRQLTDLAYETAWSDSIRAIFISGPTASGKTTFTERLAAALHLYGRPTTLLSLDDYYKDQSKLNQMEGRPDMESSDTLDFGLLRQDLAALLDGKTVRRPRFDFLSRRRIYREGEVYQLSPRGILLIEGLHALHPTLLNSLDLSRRRAVFIMPWAKLVGDRSLLDARDIRMLRRISRDAAHRGTPALATIDYWPMLDWAETQVFPDYIEAADLFVNSAMAYELCVIPALAAAEIKTDLQLVRAGALPPSRFITGPPPGYADLPQALLQARHLLASAARLPAVSPARVPDNSILNEFIH